MKSGGLGIFCFDNGSGWNPSGNCLGLLRSISGSDRHEQKGFPAGRRRSQPIRMKALTTILGLLPLALGIGKGSDVQAPLARAVVGGLTGSTLITLVLVPAVNSLFQPDPKGGRK